MAAAPDSHPAASAGWQLAARVLLFSAVAVGAFIVTLGPISDGDIYWHLAAGREILRQRALLRFDPFTLSAAGRPWADVHWLFQVGAYALYAISGFTGLAIAKAALVAGGATLLIHAAEGSGGALARGVCAVAVLGGLILDRHLVPMRPLIVTLVLLAAFLLALERLRTQAARARWAWVVLPLAQVVWCNCQGLAPIGPLLVAMYLAGAWLSTRGLRRWPFASEEASSLRPLAIALGLCVLASFVTPYGLDAVALPLRLLGRITQGRGNVFGSEVAENIPPFVLERTAPELVWHLKWVLALLAAVIALVRPRFHLAHLLAIAAFLGLALMANRNLPLFYWVAAPIAAIALARDWTGAAGLRCSWRSSAASWCLPASCRDASLPRAVRPRSIFPSSRRAGWQGCVRQVRCSLLTSMVDISVSRSRPCGPTSTRAWCSTPKRSTPTTSHSSTNLLALMPLPPGRTLARSC